LLNIFSLPFFYEFQSFPRSSFLELNNLIDNFAPQEYVIHDNKLSFFPTIFYGERDRTQYLQEPKGSPNDTLAYPSQIAIGYLASENIEKFLNEDKLLFIVFQKTLDEYAENNLSHPVIAILQKEYSEEKIYSVGDLVIMEYGEKK
jgi:hypothetical protein